MVLNNIVYRDIFQSQYIELLLYLLFYLLPCLAETLRFTESFALTAVGSRVCSAVCVEFKNCRESPPRWRRDYAPPAHTNSVQTHRVRVGLKGKCDFECRVSQRVITAQLRTADFGRVFKQSSLRSLFPRTNWCHKYLSFCSFILFYCRFYHFWAWWQHLIELV